MWFTTRCSLFLYLFLSILFPINPTNLKNLSEKHDQTSINLTNVFDHGLTILPSIFLFLIYLFIRLNVSVYILMIYKWFKIRAWFAFWLNIKEIQPSKYIVKNRNPIFLDSVLFLKFHSSRCVWNNIYKSYCLCITYFIFHSLWSFINAPWKRLGSMWLVWLISAFWLLFSLKGWGFSELFWV